MNAKMQPVAERILRLLETGEGARRKTEVDGWIRALQSAESAAAAKPAPKRTLYQINYRVAQAHSDSKGDQAGRRAALVEMIRSLAPRERHQSTSGWIVSLHIEAAGLVAELLAEPLDPACDVITVAEVTENRAVLGSSRLKSR